MGRSNLRLAKPLNSLNSHVTGGQAEKQRQRLVKMHPESIATTGFVPNPDLDLIEKKRLAMVEAQARAVRHDVDGLPLDNQPYEPFDNQVFVAEMKYWPALLSNKIYPLDVSRAMVVNEPFDDHLACYEKYPNIRSQVGWLIECFIGGHYSLVAPADYVMPATNERKGQEVPNAADEHFGKKVRVKREWSALRTSNINGQERATRTHFARELALLDTKADAPRCGRKVLGGLEIRRHIEKFGIQTTIDKLQFFLDHYGEESMAQKFTQQQWADWMHQHSNDSVHIIPALNANRAKRNQKPIAKGSEWDLDLDQAEQALQSYLAALDEKPKPATHKPNGNRQSQPRPNSENEAAPPIDFLKLDTEGIRRKYTIQIKRYDKKLNKNVYSDYLKVPGRIMLFRLDHPLESGWSLTTDMVHFDDHGCVFKAIIADPDGHIVAVGYGSAASAGSENFSGRYPEKAETAAIGRTLGYAGYGTDDVEDEEFAESPVDAAS
jgi:hypothetical protein